MYVVSDKGGDGRVSRANLDGTQGQTLVDNLAAKTSDPAFNPFQIALDVAADRMYILAGNGNFLRISLDGKTVEPFGPVDLSGGIALAGGKMYITHPNDFAGAANNRWVTRSNMTATTTPAQFMIDSGDNLLDDAITLNVPFNIALDTDAGYMYIANNGNNTVTQAKLDGTDPQAFHMNNLLNEPFGVALLYPLTVTTAEVSGVTSTTADSGGKVTYDGNDTIAVRGVCWSTSDAPDTTNGTCTENGAGVGAFTSALTGLSSGTTYFVRAYATNSMGTTAYGNEVTFTTTELPTEPPAVPGVLNVTSTATSGTYSVGSVIEITIGFSYLVWVKGIPSLALNTGGPVPGHAYYSGGSGTKIITFQYTVASGDDITKLDYWSPWALELNGGEMYSDQGVDVDLVLPVPGESGSLGNSTTLGILGTLYPLYRFYSPGLSKHLFTADENEKEYLLANMADVWQFEESPYSVFLPHQYNAATQDLKDTLMAVHRFYNAALLTHLYTADANEAAHLIAEASDVWQSEGPAFYVPTGNPEGAIPVYRFYSENLSVHLFTVDENEKNHLVETAGDIWNFEGIAYYAYP